MLKIWGRTNSINVMKVLWCAAELGLNYERVDVGLQFGGNHEPWYRAMNPNELIPTINDDGFILWESNTIVRYLTAKYGDGQLYPAELRQRADAERWMDWAFTLQAQATPIFLNLVRTPPEKRDLALVERSRQAAGEILERLDRVLAERAYVAGERFTIGDIPVGVWTYRWFALPIERPELPNLRAWYERLVQRPPYRSHVMLPLS